MANDFENQISPKEFDYEAQLQRDRARQLVPAPAAQPPEEAGSNLNIIELTLALILAMGVDFGIGWLGVKLAAGMSALGIIPVVGHAAAAAGMSAIFFLTKLTTFSVAMILGLWCLLRLKKFPWKRFGATGFIEIIPFIGELAPGWTAFILSIIIKEKIMPMLQKYGAPAEKIAAAIPAPQTQAAAKTIKAARIASEVAGKA
jgi:hypothetical protein